MASKKYKITQLQQDDSLLELHPATDADIVAVETGTGKYQGTATNVQDALEEVYDMASTGGVTGVKGDKETTYRTGDVNLTPANVGAQPEFTDGSATIATESNGVVTLKAGVAQSGGAIANSAGSDITLGTAAKKGVATSVSASSTDNDLATAKAVHDAIDALPEPMVFKGSLGTGGTITELPTPSAANEGYTYKVITAGTYAGQAAKIGDTFISDGTAWVLIPSGDEPSGTVTSVNGAGASGSHVTVTGGPVTTSGTLTVGVESGYSIPSDTKQEQWDAKYDKPNGGIPSTDMTTAVQTSLGKADTALQENQTVTVTVNGGKKADGSTDISANGSGKTALTVTMADTGITAGTYSAVQVNAKGLAVRGVNAFEVGSKSGTNTPSANLVVGGIFYQEI